MATGMLLWAPDHAASFCCAILRSRWRWSDRTKEIQSPLFPGYVFCCFDVNTRLPILTTPGVHSIVGNGKVPIPVEEREIETLRLIARSQLMAEPWPYLRLGQRVRIEQGALNGLEGILSALKKPSRLVVSVTLLQRSVAEEIDETWVRPAGRETAHEVHFRDLLAKSLPDQQPIS